MALRFIRFSLLILTCVFGLMGLAAQFRACPRPISLAGAEAFDPRLQTINSVIEAVAHVRLSAGPGAAEQELVDTADTFVRNRFYHGYSEYRFCDDWVADLAGLVWDDLRSPVLPDDILNYRRAACSQQAIVFQAIVAKLGVDYASVAFNAPGRGHFAAAAKVDGQWLYYDANQEVSRSRIPLSEVLSGEATEALYPGENGRIWRSAAEAGNVRVRDINQHPAPRAALFHNLTGVLSSFGWALFGIMWLLWELFLRLKKHAP